MTKARILGLREVGLAEIFGNSCPTADSRANHFISLGLFCFGFEGGRSGPGEHQFQRFFDWVTVLLAMTGFVNSSRVEWLACADVHRCSHSGFRAQLVALSDLDKCPFPMEMLTNCDVTCAVEREGALTSSSWLAHIFPEGALDFWAKEIAVTRENQNHSSAHTYSVPGNYSSMWLSQGYPSWIAVSLGGARDNAWHVVFDTAKT